MKAHSFLEACQLVPSPCYLVDEQQLRANLSLIKQISEDADVEFILAFKAFAMWKLFPIIREYINGCTASSLNEALLAKNEMHCLTHTYAPVYSETEFSKIAECSSHITFNSISHYLRYKEQIPHNIKCGLRINPEYSAVETELYNPCAKGSRLGVTANKLKDILPEGITGLHCHTLCESTSYELEKTLNIIDEKFGNILPMIEWLNLGGGHLVTRSDYNVEHLISILKAFKAKHPNLHIILEPGSAFAWRTGTLACTIEDIVENDNITTAMLNTSFACHMPDCLEMPYKPAIIGEVNENEGNFHYRMGGNSCLSGDYCGTWTFREPLQIGQRIIFEDMIHYTTVKTTMFNGVSHPALAIYRTNNEVEILRTYNYEDYKQRMN